MNKIASILIGFLILLSWNTPFEKSSRTFFTSSFSPETVKRISKILINFNDSIPDDSLSIYYSDFDHPVAISRNIHTAVCIDTLCRLVNITFYWEITGKFIGYSLPSGEELTKKEHDPFSASDYTKLTEILSDSLSQLRFYTSAEIHPVKKPAVQTDGITGATPPNLSSWIVPEAAYTSHTLWHLAYGVTRDTIIAYTKANLLSDQVLTNLLQDKNPYNQKIALHWITETNLPATQYIDLATGILHNGDYNSAGQALKFLKENIKDKEQLQKEVVQLLDNENFRIKNIAIQFFHESDQLSQVVAGMLINQINPDNYYQVNVVLAILEKRVQPNLENELKLCALLDSKNEHVANRAYNYLVNLKNQLPELVKQFNRYQRKNRL